MSKSRKKYRHCNKVSSCCKELAPCEDSFSRYPSKDIGNFNFPTDIKKLLILMAEDECDNRVDIVLDACPSHCFLEDAVIIAVMDNTVVVRDCESFRYICIDCICEVIVDCDTILEELFESHSLK